jgi:hypothetical protein
LEITVSAGGLFLFVTFQCSATPQPGRERATLGRISPVMSLGSSALP